MYYLILTVIIILIYQIIDKLYFSKPKTQIKNKKPNMVKEKIQENFQDIIVLNKFIDTEKDIEVTLELVYLKPEYQLEIDKYLYGKKKTTENKDWKLNFTKNICLAKQGGCQCLRDKNNEKVCGIVEDNNIYQCSQVCPECNQCHQNPSKIELQYQEFCNQAHTQKTKKRCEAYRDRLVYAGENCVFGNYTDPNVISNRKKCDVFETTNYNTYQINQDIVMRIKFNYLNPNIGKYVDYVEITNVILDNREVVINNFYSSREFIYFFIVAEEKFKGISRLIDVTGKIFFKNNKFPVVNFRDKNVVNILGSSNKIENMPEEEILDNEEYLYRKENKIQGVDFDKYSNNYLGKNRYYKCQIVSNFRTLNPITELKNTNFKRKQIMDNPNTWKQRHDINRPWDYIIN